MLSWVTYQIIACILVACVNAVFRAYGLNLKTWLCAIGISTGAQFCFGKSFSLSPSIFQPWIIGNITLALAGFLFSIFVFDGVLAFRHYIGLGLGLLAGCLLIS